MTRDCLISMKYAEFWRTFILSKCLKFDAYQSINNRFISKNQSTPTFAASPRKSFQGPSPKLGVWSKKSFRIARNQMATFICVQSLLGIGCGCRREVRYQLFVCKFVCLYVRPPVVTSMGIVLKWYGVAICWSIFILFSAFYNKFSEKMWMSQSRR